MSHRLVCVDKAEQQGELRGGMIKYKALQSDKCILSPSDDMLRQSHRRH